MDKLKPKEKRVLDYINQTIEEQGYPPSVREICSSLGIKSTSTAHMYIERLASKGYIEKLAGKSRAIKKADDLAEEGNGTAYRSWDKLRRAFRSWPRRI